MKQPKNERLHVRVQGDLRKWLERTADSRSVDISDVVREVLIEAWKKADGKKPPLDGEDESIVGHVLARTSGARGRQRIEGVL